MSKNTESPWICTKCQKLITGPRAGVILITEHSPADDEPETDPAIAALMEPYLMFAVYHQDCAPPDDAPLQEGVDPISLLYTITSDRADTLPKWVAWLDHLSEKTWVTPTGLVLAMEFWLEGHGQAVERDLPL